MAYGELYEIYKKALTKALKNKRICQQLTNILIKFVDEEFIDEDEESIDCSPEYLDIDDNMQDDDISDKENNDPEIFKLQNPKIHRRKGRPPGTK